MTSSIHLEGVFPLTSLIIVDKYLEETKNYWQDKINVSYNSADKNFDNWMHWVNFQPMLRRIYGCSFLPHHDYGKGGRGWRDLWQDSLALLIMEKGDAAGAIYGRIALPC